MRRVRSVAIGLGVLVLASCGGSPAPMSKVGWTSKHGESLATLRTDLATARATLSSLQRPDILGSCTQLRDSLGEARRGLPVPDPQADAALRAALDAVAEGTDDCVAGARGPDIPQLERSFAGLREAATLLEVATLTIDAWT